MTEAAWRAGQLPEQAFARRDGLKLTDKTAGDFVSEAAFSGRLLITFQNRCKHGRYGKQRRTQAR